MSESIIPFTKVALPFGWLGNMAPFPVTFGGKSWRTAEALFQALRFEDESIREAIRLEKSPMAAKMIAKKHKSQMVVEPMGPADLDNMLMVLQLKLQAHPALERELLATGGARLVEDCSRRPYGSGLFWGAALQEGEWVGQNWLGWLWMELRDSLRRAST
ncbi:MAG: NADAR family protein [Isosphaeraceae bacterium]